MSSATFPAAAASWPGVKLHQSLTRDMVQATACMHKVLCINWFPGSVCMRHHDGIICLQQDEA